MKGPRPRPLDDRDVQACTNPKYYHTSSPPADTARVLIPPHHMDENAAPPTVEMSLEMLSEAVGKAADDLRSVRTALDAARADIGARNTSVSRVVLKDAERVIDHLRRADEGLRDVLKDLSERD